MSNTVTSADGTTIAYDVSGSGPAVLIVGGAFNTRMSMVEQAKLLAPHFTVYVHDRRGRGDSTDTKPYAVDRELDDIAAVIDAAGGSAMVYGHSSGAILSLLAAAKGLPVTRIAAYEPPFTFDPDAPPRPDTLGGVRTALAAGDNEKAAELFMAETGMPPQAIAGVKHAPFWPGMVAIAPTTEYDLTIVGDAKAPVDVLSRIHVPTLVLDGGTSPAWAARAAEQVVAAVPDARRETVPGQDHGVDPAVLAPILTDWFAA